MTLCILSMHRQPMEEIKFHFREKSGFTAGKIVANNGGRDFFGQAVPAQKPPSVGAAESTMP